MPTAAHQTAALLGSDSSLLVMPWPEHEPDDAGHDVRSRYAELFVLPVLGPTGTWLLRRLADGLDTFPDGYELDLVETARALGLGYVPGRIGPFTRALERCVMFGYAAPVPYGLAVHRRIGTLAARQVERLPEHLRRLHEVEIRQRPLRTA